MSSDQLRVYVLQRETDAEKQVVITDSANMVFYCNHNFVDVPENKLIPFPRNLVDSTKPRSEISSNLDTNRAYGLGESVFVANPSGQTNRVQFFDYANEITATSLLDRTRYENLKLRVLTTTESRQAQLLEAQSSYQQAITEAQRVREEAIKQVPEGVSLEYLLSINDS